MGSVGQSVALTDRQEARLWRKVEATGFCWEWTAGGNGAGYGLVRVNGKSWLAHRLVYTLMVGEIPEGLVIDHLCRNTKCVNPDHLEPVEHRTNLRRSPLVAKDACKRGHLFTEENTYVWRDWRYCRECNRASHRKNAWEPSGSL